jgi:hypothetical protein
VVVPSLGHGSNAVLRTDGVLDLRIHTIRTGSLIRLLPETDKGFAAAAGDGITNVIS